MKNRIIYLTIACLISMPQLLQAQNVGIGTATPTEKLDVNGNVKISGTIQIEGGTPGAGKVLTSSSNGTASWSSAGLVQSSMYIMSDNPADANLTANGYTYFASSLVNTQKEIPGTAPAGGWIGSAPFLDSRQQPEIIAISNNKFVVFGGYSDGSSRSSGAIYDALADTWVPIPDMGDLFERSSPVTVWANGKLVVWGGSTFLGPGITNYPATGKIYDPATGVWTSMNTTNAPAGRTFAASGYNQATNELIVWGGDGGGGTYFNTGAKYNLTTNTWTAMSTGGAPAARSRMGFDVSNGNLFVTGGYGAANSVFAESYFYNCSTNSWTLLPASGLAARYVPQVEFTGSSYVVWGGTSLSTSFTDGAVFNTTNNTWTAMSNTQTPPNGTSIQSAYSNGYFVTIGGGYSYKYQVASNTWSTMYDNSRVLHGLAGNNTCLFIWGGAAGLETGAAVIQDGKRFFWNSQAITSHTTAPLTLHLYKKN